MRQIHGDPTETQQVEQIKHVNKQELQEHINENRLSVVMVQVGDIEICSETSDYIRQYSDRINFIAADYHDIPDELKKDNSDSPRSFISAPFMILFYSGRALNIMNKSDTSKHAIYGSILENKRFFDTILPTHYTLSSKKII